MSTAVSQSATLGTGSGQRIRHSLIEQDNESMASEHCDFTSPMMGTSPGSRVQDDGCSSAPSFAWLEARLRADDGLLLKQRQERISGLHTMCRAVKRQMHDIPAHPGFLRERLKEFSPVMIGITEGTWRNVRSQVSSALKHVGLANGQGRYREPLSPAWEKLLAMLDTKQRFRLSGLARYCTRKGIAPDQVDDAILEAFHEHLKATLIGKNPRELHRLACKTWNEAGKSIPGPQRRLKVPNYYTTKRYALPLEVFAESFRADFDAHTHHLGTGDAVDQPDFDPLKPISIKTRRREIHEIASALVHRGRDPQSLISLADLVDVKTAKEALRFFLERTPGKFLQAARMAYVIRTIAKHWVGVDEQHLTELTNLWLGLAKRTEHEGLTEKNRERLHQMDEPELRDGYLNLPETLLNEVTGTKTKVQRDRTERKKALLIQTALLAEFWIMCPLRIKNMASVQIGKHLIPMGNTFRLSFHGAEVKNNANLDPCLPEESAELLRLYLKKYRPLLTKEPSDWLFPGTKGRHKNSTALGRQFTDAAKKYAGLILNPHLVRHIAAKLHLEANPGDYGTVKLILGHKSIKTTISIYCGTEGPAAFERYDEHVLELRRTRREQISKAKSAKRKTKNGKQKHTASAAQVPALAQS